MIKFRGMTQVPKRCIIDLQGRTPAQRRGKARISGASFRKVRRHIIGIVKGENLMFIMNAVLIGASLGYTVGSAIATLAGTSAITGAAVGTMVGAGAGLAVGVKESGSAVAVLAGARG